jgi:NSS family neurotransmitter:Na+ symporter
MTVMDLIFGNIMLALGGVLICLFLAYSWKVRNSLKEISIGNKRFKLKSLWTFNIKYLAPVVVTLILVFIVIQSIIG